MASNECASYDSIIFLVRRKVQTVNDECWSYIDAKSDLEYTYIIKQILKDKR